MKFKNHIALISGGLGDICQAVAKKLADEGAHISIADLKEESHAFELENFVKSKALKFLYCKTDLSKEENVVNWHKETVNKIGLPDMIIYGNAIVKFTESFLDISASDWQNELNVNLNSAFYLAKVSSKALIQEKKPGKIVLIGSWAAHAVHTKIPTYCVAKAGLRMFGQCIAKELAPHNIAVNEIAPGYVDAGLSGKTFNENPVARENAKEKIPNKTLITSEEIAENISFLCDFNNKHMIGSTLLMDGGLSLCVK